jgi:hypothetical protein
MENKKLGKILIAIGIIIAIAPPVILGIIATFTLGPLGIIGKIFGGPTLLILLAMGILIAIVGEIISKK